MSCGLVPLAAIGTAVPRFRGHDDVYVSCVNTRLLDASRGRRLDFFICARPRVLTKPVS